MTGGRQGFFEWATDDRDYLIDRACRRYPNCWPDPVRALRYCCGVLGYTIEFRDGVRVYIDRQARVVYLDRAAAEDPMGRAELLAEGLGLLRTDDPHEAYLYALVFLDGCLPLRAATRGATVDPKWASQDRQIRLG